MVAWGEVAESVAVVVEDRGVQEGHADCDCSATAADRRSLQESADLCMEQDSSWEYCSR